MTEEHRLAAPIEVFRWLTVGKTFLKMQTNHGKRLIQLDVLRGLAILLVVGCHYSMSTEGRSAGRLQPLNDAFVRFGWSGVDLFFVLSGFLVGGLLFNELKKNGALDVPRFLIRRAFKIWPLYFAYIGLMIGYYAFKERSVGEALSIWWPHLLHVQNYYWLSGPRGHTWSLAVEEHFYLALPLMLWLATSWRITSGRTTGEARGATSSTLALLPILAFTVIIACALGRVWICLRDPQVAASPYPWIYTPTHLRVGGLFFGVLLAYWHHFEPHRLSFASKHSGKLLLAGVVLVAPLVVFPRSIHPLFAALGYDLVTLGYGAILLAAVYSDVEGRGLLSRFFGSFAARALAFVGVFSYPIYLWHLDAATNRINPITDRFLVPGNETRWLFFAAVHFLLALLAGIFWAKLLEKPSLVLRDRLFPRRSPAPLETSTPDETASETKRVAQPA